MLCGQWNAISIVFKYLEKWDDDENNNQNLLVTVFANAGAIIGSFVAPYLTFKGKRVCIIATNVLMIIGFGV